MKLDLNCVRDILMDIEDVADSIKSLLISESSYKAIFTLCQKYEYDVLHYHLLQCQRNGYFVNGNKTFDEDFAIVDLSPKAHEILAKIRDERLWKKILKAAPKVIGAILPQLPEIIEGAQALA